MVATDVVGVVHIWLKSLGSVVIPMSRHKSP